MALAGIAALAAIAIGAPIASAAAPAAPTTVFQEGFENGTGSTSLPLTSYVGAEGEEYTADPAWLTGCNGEIVDFETPVEELGNCENTNDTGHTRQLAYGLGVLNGSADPATNHAVTAYTDGNPGANLTEFETVEPIALPANGRYLTFSVNAAAVNCSVSAPLYQFYLTSGSTEIPVGGQINACTSGETVEAPATGSISGREVSVGTYTSDGSVLFTGSSLGILMRNANGSGIGNDAAFDDVKVLDATPALEKSFSPATLDAGGVSQLTFTITNTSELAEKKGWSFTDDLPEGLTIADPAGASTTCTNGEVTATAGGDSIAVAGDLSAGQESCTATVSVTASAAGTYTNGPSNVTTVGLDGPPPTTIHFVAADLSIEKSTTAETVVPGKEITYDLVVNNNGPDAAESVKVSDDLPEGLTFVSASEGCTSAAGAVTCTAPSLAAGSSLTFKVTAKIASSVDHAIDNTAKVTSETPDPEPENNESESHTPIKGQADLSITKVAAADTVEAGGQIMYTLVVKNNGPSDATGVTVDDPMAEGLTLVSADPSQGSCSTAEGKVSCSLGGISAGGSAQVLVTATAGDRSGKVTNKAKVQGDQEDPEPKNNEDGSTVEISSGPEPTFDLAVTKTSNVKNPTVGQKVTYTIAVKNKGPEAAPEAKVTDTLNKGVKVISVKPETGKCTTGNPFRCELGTIQAGETVKIKAVVEVTKLGGQRNAAGATGHGKDTDPKNNLDVLKQKVTKVKLKLTKVASRASAHPGQLIDYTIKLRNLTKGIATKVEVCDRMPSGLGLVSSKPKGKLSKGRLCWTVGKLGPKATKTFVVVARALDASSGRKVNRVTATGPDALAAKAASAVAIKPAPSKPTPVTG
ncbi:MAG: DUF11 domain-containing protein [Solirubrobacterales bacterium]